MTVMTFFSADRTIKYFELRENFESDSDVLDVFGGLRRFPKLQSVLVCEKVYSVPWRPQVPTQSGRLSLTKGSVWHHQQQQNSFSIFQRVFFVHSYCAADEQELAIS